VRVGEMATMHASLLIGPRVSGVVCAASGVVFLVRALEGMM
jgi:hypothetical protein